MELKALDWVGKLGKNVSERVLLCLSHQDVGSFLSLWRTARGRGAPGASSWPGPVMKPVWPPALMPHKPAVLGDTHLSELVPTCHGILRGRVWEEAGDAGTPGRVGAEVGLGLGSHRREGSPLGITDVGAGVPLLPGL